MPELPEVEVVTRSLKKTIKNRKIIKITVNNRNLRFKLPENFESILKNKIVKNISRKSKYIIFDFGNNFFTILHLGMSGTLHIPSNKNVTNLSFYSNATLPKKHNHIIIEFDKIKLIYNDPRRFGFFKILKNKSDYLRFFTRIGPEAISKEFNKTYLSKILKNRTKNIKNLLLDQKLVSGLGNIYVNEILFQAKINPFKKSYLINLEENKRIVKYSKIILKKAIDFGGSSIRDFKGITGKSGNFQSEFKVYDRTKKRCSRNNCSGQISRKIISNRSTFICSVCQK
mgnify:CR=1 FL=1